MSRTIKVTVVFLAAMAVAAIAGPWLSPNDYQATNFGEPLLPPSAAGMRIFGTDDLGRDLFVRTMMGVRVTLLVAVVASLVSLVIGVSYGAIAGYYGGMTDRIMMRSVDIIYALPFMFLVILIAAQLGATRLIDNMGKEPVDGRHDDVFIGLLGFKSGQPEATQFSLVRNAVGSQDFKERKEVACSSDKYAISH